MTALLDRWQQAMGSMPLIAILRGLEPVNALSVGETLVEAGFRVIEVPLNSPNAPDSIKLLSDHLSSDVVVGAGTVLNAIDVQRVHKAGGTLIVAPNFDITVATESVSRGLLYCPGIATPSEAFAALHAGAHALKLFPAEAIPPAAVKAMRAVLPSGCQLLPVGGISTDNMTDYQVAGATGFGIGSALFSAGKSTGQIRQSADAFVATWLKIRQTQH